MTDLESRPTKRSIPVPNQNLESKPFWDAAKDGRFLIKRCSACDKPHWYPRTMCPFCASTDTEWVESKGEGVIYAFSVMRRGTAPYAIGYVTLDEGVSLLTNFIDYDLDALEIGQRVRLKWSPTGQSNPPVFTFAPV
ncbi:Zn-ribbon domain-containing OB-fold protein [Bradyrhizobium uaiense]|uniref:DNA-binding protein n=1 Tax=Bradyrhizobium uaiense TaxID=2594946 RepID=A0A6P1BUY0_9BRAD|nr:OB-fold domain-containing protein [Bradyrhizobium uaiense]NEV02328.1 DNA-binding protein [Bradyrhizobium uaiense]